MDKNILFVFQVSQFRKQVVNLPREGLLNVLSYLLMRCVLCTVYLNCVANQLSDGVGAGNCCDCDVNSSCSYGNCEI